MEDNKKPPGPLTFSNGNDKSHSPLENLLHKLATALGDTEALKHNSTIDFITSPNDASDDLRTTISIFNAAIKQYFETCTKIGLLIKIYAQKAEQHLENPTEITTLQNNLANALSNILHAIDPAIQEGSFKLTTDDSKQLYELIQTKENPGNVLSWFQQIQQFASEILTANEDEQNSLAKDHPEINALLTSIQQGSAEIVRKLQQGLELSPLKRTTPTPT